MTSRRARPAFTLLELILAVTIGVVLLGALYLSLSTHFRLAQSGRDLLDDASLARTLLTRMSADIAGSLGPTTPAPEVDPATSTTADPLAATPMTAATTTMQSSGPGNLGVQGDSQRLVLTVSRVPRELDPATEGEQANVSDLRRIAYWLVGGGDSVKGLARQEISRLNGPEADSTPPDVANPDSYIIAARVHDLTFEYHDGSAWQASWDGSATDPETKLTIGPPVAIAITLTLRKTAIAKDGPLTKYRQVIAIPTANRMMSSVP